MNRAWIRVGVLGGALAVAMIATPAWWHRHELRLARSEIDRGEYPSALRRLESLAASRFGWAGVGGGALDYWLGVCRWRVGRRAEALTVFARVPQGGEYGTLAAGYAAEGLLDQGRWRAAEERLEQAMARGGRPGLEAVCDR